LVLSYEATIRAGSGGWKFRSERSTLECGVPKLQTDTFRTMSDFPSALDLAPAPAPSRRPTIAAEVDSGLAGLLSSVLARSRAHDDAPDAANEQGVAFDGDQVDAPVFAVENTEALFEDETDSLFEAEPEALFEAEPDSLFESEADGLFESEADGLFEAVPVDAAEADSLFENLDDDNLFEVVTEADVAAVVEPEVVPEVDTDALFEVNDSIPGHAAAHEDEALFDEQPAALFDVVDSGLPEFETSVETDEDQDDDGGLFGLELSVGFTPPGETESTSVSAGFIDTDEEDLFDNETDLFEDESDLFGSDDSEPAFAQVAEHSTVQHVVVHHVVEAADHSAPALAGTGPMLRAGRFGPGSFTGTTETDIPMLRHAVETADETSTATRTAQEWAAPNAPATATPQVHAEAAAYDGPNFANNPVFQPGITPSVHLSAPPPEPPRPQAVARILSPLQINLLIEGLAQLRARPGEEGLPPGLLFLDIRGPLGRFQTDNLYTVRSQIDSAVRGGDMALVVPDVGIALFCGGLFFPGDLEVIGSRLRRKALDANPSIVPTETIRITVGGALAFPGEDPVDFFKRGIAIFDQAVEEKRDDIVISYADSRGLRE
jgi:hypothetical protein